ncbi:sigma 54-interacting transcriptional regulator [Paenisporosarcina antarctica]|uniref:PAS domain S-box protein n=1 Tax=Paenisporosarcina antarctica TaxID=417367 RepID=A0A4V1AMV3_9BACL|nr:sigma 54-interacting transcriptional regulator [Paenisporosarcina antarctica]QBP40575.1 PAS domain S-box protein [Paenisporosarcina antarctica]
MNVKDFQLLPFYRFASDHISVGIHAIDSNGRTILYNEKMKNIEGLDLHDVADRTLLELFQFDQQESTLLKVLQSEEHVLNVKQTYWNRNGHEITTINDTYPVFENGKLIGAVELARDVTTLERMVYQPLRRYGDPITFSTITAVSDSMKQVILMAQKAATARLSVLLVGEAGTGKDLVAEGIHNELSPPMSHFYTLNCHNSDPTILTKLKDDLILLETSTIFCVRIDLLTLGMQQQLLDLVNDPNLSKHLFLASVGADPVNLIASGELLKDLYYFFASMSIVVLPLRDRRKDIDPFVHDYFARHRIRFGSAIMGMTNEVRDIFNSYDWPGNLKEVEILLDEIVSMLTFEEMVTFEMLPLHFKLKVQEMREPLKRAEDFVVQSNRDLLPLDEYLREAEMYYLQKVMGMFEGNVTKSAVALGMSRQNLQYRLRKMKK